MSVNGNGHKPEFATNDEAAGERVADAINTLLAGIRQRWANPPNLAIASAYFNPGGFNLLADELDQAGAVRLLLGAEPTDVADGNRIRPLAQRRSRRGLDPQVSRALEGHARSLAEDRDLLGFTREADAHARKLVEWIRTHPNVEVRRYEAGFLHGKAFVVETDHEGVIAGSSNFTYAGLARNNELNLGHYQPSTVGQVMDWFNKQWDASVPYDLAALYEARWMAHQPWDVFLRMLHENYGGDVAEATAGSRLGLTDFQADGVWRAKRILDRRTGVLIADEVGLGKTFLGGELIYEATVIRRQKVLIICPATLRDSTWKPFLREKNLRADVVSFEELVASIDTAGEKTSALQGLDEYAMILVDEAHAFRNETTQRADALRRALQGVVPKNLVLLTATPVNNSLEDLFALIMYFARTDSAFADVGIPSLRRYFNTAIAQNPEDLSPEHLFDVLDAVAVRRTRRFVKNHYVGDKVWINGVEKEISFPTCRVHRVDYDIDDVLPGVFDDLAVALGADIHDDTAGDPLTAGVILTDPGEVLTMARYVPSRFRLDGDTEQYESQNAGLLRSALLKRFESSAYAFGRTVTKMIESHNRFLHALAAGLVLTGDALREWAAVDSDDLDEFIDNLDDDENVHDAADYNITDLTAAVEADRDLLTRFKTRVETVDPSNDPKVKALLAELCEIADQAKAEGIGEEDTRNKTKTLIFTYFADTAAYLETALKDALITDPRLACFHDRFEVVAGPNKRDRADIITGFAPQTAGTGLEEDKYDLLVATDVLAEGVNLQQARHIINYDLPWNPMRLVQRHGRIDRIGSPHREVFMRCFFPDEDLDRILGLEARLQAKIKAAAAAVGVGEVLPGIEAVERNLAETRDQIAALRREEAALFDDNTNAALSGEEYRRKLANAFRDPATKNRVLDLPWGAGTGFVRDGATPGIVFCARVGDHDKPLFRYLPLNDDYTVRTIRSHDETAGTPGDPVPEVIRQTLSALAHADPGADTTAAHLTDAMYTAAFDAWSVAKHDIYEDWTRQTDAATLAPPLPRVMRDAVDYIETHGGVLGDQQDTLAERLRAPYTPRVQRAVRAALATDGPPRDVVTAIAAVADDLGLIRPELPEPLPPITPDDIHLICWTAISPAGNQGG